MKLKDIHKLGYRRFLRAGETILDLTKPYVTGIEEGYAYEGFEEYTGYVSIQFKSGKTLDLPEDAGSEYIDIFKKPAHSYRYWSDDVRDLLCHGDLIVTGKYLATQKPTLVTEKNLIKCIDILKKKGTIASVYSLSQLKLIFTVNKTGKICRFVPQGGK